MKQRSFRSCAIRRAGSALVIAMVAISGLAVASMTIIQYSLSVDRERTDDSSDASAHYLAESAIHEAATAIDYGGTGNLGSEAAPVAFAEGVFWTVTTDVGDDLWSIRATALASKGRRTLEAVVALDARGSIDAGLISKDKLFLGKGVFADSYDSDLGTYASQATKTKGSTKYASANARIVSDGDVHLRKDLELFGDLAYGYDETLHADQGALDGIDGDVTEFDRDIDYPAVDAPTAPPSLGKVHLHGDAKSSAMDLVIGPGRVHYESITTHTDAKLKIVGPATIVVDKDFRLDSQLTVDTTNGPVALWVGESFVIQQKAAMTVTSGRPADFFALVGTKADKKDAVKKLKVKLDAAFTGVLYAPHSKVEVRKNTDLFGALIANTVRFKKGARLHYDEALGRMDSEVLGEPCLRLVSLRVVDFDGEQGRTDRRDPLSLLGIAEKDLTRIDASWTAGERELLAERERLSIGLLSSVGTDEWWPDDKVDPEENWDVLEKL